MTPNHDSLEQAAPPNAAAVDRTQDTLASLDWAKQNIARVKSEIQHLQTTHQAMLARVRSSGRAYYRMSRLGGVSWTGGLEAWLTHFGRLRRMERLVASNLASERFTRERIHALRLELDAMTRQVDAKKIELEFLLRKQADPYSPAYSAYSAYPAWAGGAGASQGLTRRQSGSWSSEPQRSSRSSDPIGRVASTDRGQSNSEAGGFESMRGRLSNPVTALTMEDGSPTGALQLECKQGTAVRAVAAGTVTLASAGQTGRYTVVVSHGRGYQSLYTQLGTVDVEVGDAVSQGARLGTAGDGTVDASQEKTVRIGFMIKQQGSVLDARPWLGLGLAER